ncbi:hypothetical protein V6N13_082459 [Hibiscus sabdariffa]|uniref:DRBM domain-containing protein n=1 Tax=Hibiscus sabdariffa TaxID=183260 RepID=A0ABR2Q467_9ROSI
MYKSKLQELCQRRQWALPRYTSMKDGPDHNPCFKSSVFLNGTLFHSSVRCKSCKEAQNDAAKSAFLHFTSSSYSPAAAANPIPVQEADSGIYKNMLQELTQREEWSLPEYKTTKCGVPHSPTFFSSVQVEGHHFYGKAGKSRKEAEINAAKLAYTNLTERLQISSSEVSSPQQLDGEHLKLMSTSVVLNSKENEEYDEVQEVEVGEKELANSTTSLDSSGFQGEPLKSMSGSDLTPAVENEEHAEENGVPEVKTGETEGSISCESTCVDISDLSISDSNTEKVPGVRSYLLNNRVRVYPCYPDIAFPQGITVLPISDDKWVAVSLEFPNERDD